MDSTLKVRTFHKAPTKSHPLRGQNPAPRPGGQANRSPQRRSTRRISLGSDPPPRARRVVYALERVSVPYTIVSLDPEAEERAAESGRAVLVGDVSRHLIAEEAGLSEARVVLAVDSSPATVEQFARVAREHNPHVVVLAWADDIDAAADLHRDGLVDHVVTERQAVLDALIAHTLGHYEVSETDSEAILHSVLGPESATRDSGSADLQQGTLDE